ncbi:MAG: TIGR03986 family CRISPR-associated RAMP protein [Saprospiraceae bacterium]
MSYNNKESFKAKAPYRFVPLSKQIVSPHWADAVSHDIPFEDGVSGTIEVELTAHADIFISSGKQKKEDANEVLEFSNFNGKYFIPATSLKGMIRNVMEIMSFGGIKSMTQNNKYAFRDLRNNTYLKPFKPDKIFCGYLRKSEDGYFAIRDCGIPGRISQTKIDEYFKTSMTVDFDRGGRYIRGAKDREKSAVFKNKQYQHVINSSLSFHADKDNTGRLISEINTSGTKKGKIVFTGQPGANNLKDSKKRNGKNLEFVFFQNGNESIKDVDKEIIKNFKFAYFDHDKSRWSYDWKYWRNELHKGREIPVFFHKDRAGKVIHLGLSYLYKLPYKNSVHDLINNTQKGEQLGLSDLIFGNINDKNSPLKGRVFFSQGWLNNDVIPSNKRTEVLASPKASYYPFYLKQGDGNIVTYMNSAEIAGWKKYPVHQSLKQNKSPNDNEKVAVKFKPLPSGAKFKFVVNYHNLRKIELGALLSALTFHGCNEAFHSIGMAKPLGYGKVKLNINTKFKQEEYLKSFEAFMSSKLSTNWCQTVQMKELLAMSYEDAENDKALTYMELDVHPKIVKQNDSLKKYATAKDVCNIQLCDDSFISSFQKWLKEDEEKLKFAGSLDVAIAKFKIEEVEKLATAFNQKKQALIGQIKANRIAKKEAERLAREEQFKQQQQAKIAIVQSQSLEGFIGDKKTKKINDLKNLVEQYGSKKYECKRNELSTKFPAGYLTENNDIEFIEQWLLNGYQNGGNSIKKQYAKPFSTKHPIFKEIIKWLGSEKSQQLYNQLNQS